jgi:hypothetical protein
MESYLQLPHKLKPIFVSQKRYESIIIGLYKVDPKVLYELCYETIEKERTRQEEMAKKIGESEVEREKII